MLCRNLSLDESLPPLARQLRAMSMGEWKSVRRTMKNYANSGLGSAEQRWALIDKIARAAGGTLVEPAFSPGTTAQPEGIDER